MSATTDAVSVDRTGTIVDLIAVKFGTGPIVERADDGSLVAYAETWDRDSLVMPTTRVRLLRGHDRTHPIGWLTDFRTEADGLHARGQLVGGSASLDDVRALVAARLLDGVSIGFAPTPDADVWSPPQRRNGLAQVVRRQARIREVSIVDRAAVAGSRVLRISTAQAGPSTATTAALAEAEGAVRGTGVAAMRRLDHQGEVALLLAEADQLVEGRQRWAGIATPDPDISTPAAPLPPASSWQQIRDEIAEADAWALREEAARADIAEDIHRRQLAENYAARQAEQTAAIWRAHASR